MVSRPRVFTMVGPLPTRRPAKSHKQVAEAHMAMAATLLGVDPDRVPEALAVLLGIKPPVPAGLDNFDEVFS